MLPVCRPDRAVFGGDRSVHRPWLWIPPGSDNFMRKTMLQAVSTGLLPKWERSLHIRSLKRFPRTNFPVFRSARCGIGSVAGGMDVIHTSRVGSVGALDRLRSAADRRVENAIQKPEDPSDLEGPADVATQSGGVEEPLKTRKRLGVGAFQQLPVVSPSSEICGTAVRRAKMVRPTKGIMNVAKRERNRGAKQVDTLTKELCVPLRNYVQKFPELHRFHPYEQALLELTLGDGKYEETLHSVDLLRKKVLDVGKNRASLCAKSSTKKEAEEHVQVGFTSLENIFKTYGSSVDNLKEVAKILRAMPVVHPETPTLCLVGAPNVGKSSLVRILSSGKPEVCNYPFTTRGISMGHIFVDSKSYQVTDTPGLLKRPDEKRNNIERLTLAALSHLPTAVLYVHDLTGDCGTSVVDQWHIYKEMKSRFSERPWLDVVSKADLLPPAPLSPPENEEDSYRVLGPPGSIRISVKAEQGVGELVRRVHHVLTHELKHLLVPDDSVVPVRKASVVAPASYFPAWPPTDRSTEN